MKRQLGVWRIRNKSELFTEGDNKKNGENVQAGLMSVTRAALQLCQETTPRVKLTHND